MFSSFSEKLVSIIVPVYNVENFLEKCIDSLLNQSYSNIEIILVDDGSPDSFADICDKYSSLDSRVVTIHKKNGGLSSARNAGLRICKGAYIMFVDSDDWIAQDLIEKMVKEIQEHSVQLVTCGRCVVDGNIKKYITSGKNEMLSVEEVIKKSIFNDKIGIAAWGKLYERQILDQILFPEGEIHEDVAVIYNIFNRCSSIFVMNYAGYYYRYNSEGISKQSYSTKYDVVLKHVLDNERMINSKYPHLACYSATMVAQSCVDMLVKILKTEGGYETFNLQYNKYRDNLILRKREYIIFVISMPKRLIWSLIFLVGNKTWAKLYKKLGIYK